MYQVNAPPPPPPPPNFREEENETINLNSSASGNRKVVTMIFSGNVTCFTLRKIDRMCMLENYQLSFAFRFKIGIDRDFCLNSSLLVLTCTFNG